MSSATSRHSRSRPQPSRRQAGICCQSGASPAAVRALVGWVSAVMPLEMLGIGLGWADRFDFSPAKFRWMFRRCNQQPGSTWVTCGPDAEMRSVEAGQLRLQACCRWRCRWESRRQRGRTCIAGTESISTCRAHPDSQAEVDRQKKTGHAQINLLLYLS